MAPAGYQTIPTVDTAEEDAAYVKMEFGVVPPQTGWFGVSEAMCKRVKYAFLAVAVLAMVGAGAFQVRSNMGDGLVASDLHKLQGGLGGAQEEVGLVLPISLEEASAGLGLHREIKVQEAPGAAGHPMPVGSNLGGNLAMEVVEGAGEGEGESEGEGAGEQDDEGEEKKKEKGGWGKGKKKSKKKHVGEEVACPASPEGVPTPDECLEWKGSTYLAVRAELTWDQAELTCTNLGGHLASVRSSKENTLVSDLFKGEVFWIGLRYDRQSKNWAWSDGAETGNGDKWSKHVYSNWGHGKPAHEHHGLKADCVMGNYHLGGTGAWADSYCSDVKKRKHPFVCRIAGEEGEEGAGDGDEVAEGEEGAKGDAGAKGAQQVPLEEPSATNLSVAREL